MVGATGIIAQATGDVMGLWHPSKSVHAEPFDAPPEEAAGGREAGD
jgi:hypothetical protein